MVIRHAIDTDIPSIVALLKLSLGEGLMPKSEAFWKWKHIDNPFGASPVVVAEEEGQLIGVRAFMRWKWRHDGEVFSALRAVDTATHPEHQGKGIFKKLTMKLVDDCKAGGDHFIFNTPNEKSRPGYLKMGWDNLGKTPVRIKAVLGNGKGKAKVSNQQNILNPELEKLIKAHLQNNNECIITDIRIGYLQWRYVDVPVADYYFRHDAEYSFIFIYRLKTGKRGTELRITDLLVNEEILNYDALKLVLKEIVTVHRPAYISISGYQSRVIQQILSRNLFLPAIQIGPILTARHLNTNADFPFWSKNQRMASFGDLELF